jgi:hypothetical protein
VTYFATWCGFVGAWLLVAGPVYQAALELREQDIAHEEMQAAVASVPQPPPLSPWWWLLPPVGYVLARRRSTRYREQMLNSLNPQQVEAMVQYINKATGWLLVGLGGSLIAIKETWELSERYEWSVGVFAGLTVAAAALCLFAIAARVDQTRRVLEAGRPVTKD